MLQKVASVAAGIIPSYCPGVKENELRMFVHYLPTYCAYLVSISAMANPQKFTCMSI